MHDDPDKCPRCKRLGPVIAEDNMLGRVYECFHCQRQIKFFFLSAQVPVTWAMVRGEKCEVHQREVLF
jgi:hypothetical protein